VQDIGSLGIYPEDWEHTTKKGASTKVAKSDGVARTANTDIYIHGVNCKQAT
jgi:hypothetical protein